ncbi:unnamed protein product, partial [Rotaria magnacalcarata]
KDVYCTISDGDQPVWKIPAQNPCIIPFHDESTFKIGETSARSSDDLNYVQNSATAGINVGVEGYFNNEVILSQFERLFQLVSFKQDFEGHQFEVVVDNARTYSAREYSINEFNKGIGTKRPVDSITYVDDKGKVISISCRFTTGDHRGKTKGLLELAKELKLPCLPSIKLTELRTLLAQHAAFQNVSKLEIFARKYNIKVIFCPKFHCELNAIEGLWCHMKQYVRKKSDQTFSTMLRLIPQSRENFKERKIHMKLFRRFWHSLNAYDQENGALAGRYCDQPAQFRHRNMYLISKDHLSLETRRTILTNLQRMADEKLNRLTNEYDRKVLELTQQYKKNHDEIDLEKVNIPRKC